MECFIRVVDTSCGIAKSPLGVHLWQAHAQKVVYGARKRTRHMDKRVKVGITKVRQDRCDIGFEEGITEALDLKKERHRKRIRTIAGQNLNFGELTSRSKDSSLHQ
ncbi:hypothetical protein Scep_018027 [Stephania cephalantha]|uniref:Uncharacterized protein n=1 Tax=Stephania cephalantha TaxID=152367 RepID=A0AAP0NVF8_9MAGN